MISIDFQSLLTFHKAVQARQSLKSARAAMGNIRPKKKIVMLPSPDQNLKIGSVGIFFLFFFYVPWESWVFQYFF